MALVENSQVIEHVYPCKVYAFRLRNDMRFNMCTHSSLLGSTGSTAVDDNTIVRVGVYTLYNADSRQTPMLSDIVSMGYDVRVLSTVKS